MAVAAERRVLPAELRPLSAGHEAASLVMDRAAGDGGGGGIGAKTLDGVFCLGAGFEESMQRAEAAKNSGDEKAKVLGLVKAADAFVQSGNLQGAANQVEQAQKLITEMKFEEGRACAMVIVSKIYAKQGKLSTVDQLDEAMDLAAEAQEKFRKFGSKKSEAAAFLALAAARHANKKYEDGNLAAKEAQVLLEDLGDKTAVAEVYEVVTDGYLMKDDTKKAAKMMYKAKAIQAELGERVKEAECMHRVGKIELQGNDTEKAFAAFEEAQKMFQEAGDAKRQVAVMKTIQDFHLKKGKAAEAVRIGQQMVTVLHDANDSKGEGMALVSLAELLLEKNQIDSAGKVLGSAHQVFTTIRDGEGMVRVNEVGAKFKNASLKKEIEESMDQHNMYYNYPVNPVVEMNMNGLAKEAFADMQKGL